MKRIGIVLFFLTVCLYAQDSSTASNEGEVDSAKKWYFLLGAGVGNSTIPPTGSTIQPNGAYSGGRIGFEYRPNPYFGIGFGLSGHKSIFRTEANSDTLLLLLLIGNAFSGSAAKEPYYLPMALLASGYGTSEKYGLQYNTVYIDFTFHPNQDKFFDPYIGIGLMGGACIGPCTVGGGEAKLGTQLNFGNIFVYLEGRYQMLAFTGTGNATGGYLTLENKIGNFGIGTRF